MVVGIFSQRHTIFKKIAIEFCQSRISSSRVIACVRSQESELFMKIFSADSIWVYFSINCKGDPKIGKIGTPMTVQPMILSVERLQNNLYPYSIKNTKKISKMFEKWQK